MYGNLPEVTLASGQVVRGIVVHAPGSPKTAVLSLPTNEQTARYLNSIKSIRSSLGRGKSRVKVVHNRRADYELFQALRLEENGPAFDELEGSNGIAELLKVETVSCKQSGAGYSVSLSTPLGTVRHTLRQPSQREITQYRRNIVTVVKLPHGMESIRHHIAPACGLYDSISVSIEGYTDSFTPETVPPHHKAHAVVALVQAVQ